MNKKHIHIDNKKLEQLRIREAELFNEMEKVRDEIEVESVKDLDLQGKYIYIPDRGYMFVCKNELYYDCKGGWTVSLRGFAFNGESSDYLVGNYLMYDAFDQWTFRMEDFSFHIRNNQIQYVEKDVFYRGPMSC